jgi:serine/threonine protein kinase
VFLNERGSCLKLGNVGLERDVASITKKHMLADTLIYMAPELVDGGDEGNDEENVTNKIDVWAFGCVLYEVVCLESAFKRNAKIFKIFRDIIEFEPVKLPENVHGVVRLVLSKTVMKKKPMERASADFLLSLLEKFKIDSEQTPVAGVLVDTLTPSSSSSSSSSNHDDSKLLDGEAG